MIILNKIINDIITYINNNKEINNIDYLESLKTLKQAIDEIEADFLKIELRNKEEKKEG